ncbi:hypothetical protein [Actinoallomurus iriomotensis]|uniref:Uncharacterized protein n=1 Tax=Actinoallomurus iriomotensis TaxID=478107 RepID=A0A9W6S5H5_9ACTN|nr:hypothetical protein [Actinoallomurus iriomotensis]GLY85997.1 hypothetical protein Airi02_039260 [Actinoallomurus iriomotensis]
MDAELTSLAQSAGTTLVTLMATAGWERARDSVVRLWHRIQPDRAEAVAVELDSSNADALAAAGSDGEETLSELRAQWQGRMRRLLIAHPEAADALRSVLDEIGPPEQDASAASVVQHAVVSGDSRVYQAGRDQHITDR